MTKLKVLIAIFKEFLSSYTRYFLFLFLLLLAEGLITAMSVLAIVPMADYLIDSDLKFPSKITLFVILLLKSFNISISFWVFGAIFVSVNLIKGIFEILIRYAVLLIKYKILGGLVDDSLKIFFKARLGFFIGSDQGRLLNTMNKELANIGDTLGVLTMFLAQLAQLSIYLIVPFWLNPTMTGTAIGLAFIFGVPFLFLHGVSYRLGRSNMESGNIFMSTLNEILGASRLILGFGRQGYARKIVLNKFLKHVHITLRSQTLTLAITRLYQPLAMMAAVIAMGFAVNQNISVSELAAVMWSLLATVPILSALLQGNISVSNFLPSYEQLVSLRENAISFEEIEGNRVFSRFERGIEFKNISFTYPGRVQTLNNINLTIQKGKMTALVGESGSGKSTITDLILGLQSPETGQVFIDGIPFGDYKQNSFRERVGYVPQEPLLFHASIRDNLMWSLNEASDNAIWSALRLANADEFIKELPLGLDTVVGDRGVRLSGGQRQRIALARALLRKPDLLILDEATSSLDSDSERLIQISIEDLARDTTIIVVAHRLSTISNADQVYVFQDGNVIEEGPFKILIDIPHSFLSAMVASQHA